MPSERNYYVLCDDNCRFEGMTKSQIQAAIAQAVESGTIYDLDTGVATKLKEINHNKKIEFWVGTQSEYNALEERAKNVLYIISDDNSKDELLATVERLSSELTAVETTVNDTMASQIEAMQNAVDTAGADIEQLEEDIDTAETVINPLRQRILTAESTITQIRFDLSYPLSTLFSSSTTTSTNQMTSGKSFSLSTDISDASRVYIVLKSGQFIEQNVILPQFISNASFIIRCGKNFIKCHFNVDGNVLYCDGVEVVEGNAENVYLMEVKARA